MSDQGNYAVHHDYDRDIFHEEPLLGTAQWMPPAQVADRYIFEKGDLWLGRNGDNERTPIGRKDDSHVLLCAKTRSGKGRALITNNLLLWPGSVFVNDPKGENASVTAARRGRGSEHATESLGQKVCVLDSHETATVDPGYRAYYNPIAEIRADDPDAETKAAIIAESCISSKKEKADPTWDNKAKTFIKTLILHIATDQFVPDEDRNMVTLRRFIVAGDFIAVGHVEDQVPPEQLKANPPDGFMMLLEGMKANKSFDGIVSDQARSLLESYASQPKMWNSIRTSAEENTDWIDDNRIRSILKPGKYAQTFTADELQGRAGGISVYMCLPSGMKDHFASWPRIVVNMMLTAAQTNGNRHPATGHQTLMMLDEFASMERMRRIETAAADIAGAGVKLFFVVQTLAQLEAVYEKNWETFASCADTHIYYGFNDNFTADYVSKRLGEVEIIRTTRSQSTADNTTITDGESKGGSSSIAENTSDARSKGGGRGTSRGGSSGTSDSTGWGPSIFFRTLATTNQFARQTGRNFGSTRQENYQRTKTKGTTKTKGDNWGETHSIATGRTRTLTEQENLHKKPLAAINELMRLFGDVEDENDPTYPGIGLISTASRDPMLIHKCHYDEDRFFEGLFDPHPKWGFAEIPVPPTSFTYDLLADYPTLRFCTDKSEEHVRAGFEVAGNGQAGILSFKNENYEFGIFLNVPQTVNVRAVGQAVPAPHKHTYFDSLIVEADKPLPTHVFAGIARFETEFIAQFERRASLLQDLNTLDKEVRDNPDFWGKKARRLERLHEDFKQEDRRFLDWKDEVRRQIAGKT